MINASGIGTYLRNLVPGIINASQDIRFSLLCKKDAMSIFPWTHADNVSLIDCQSPIYSINEQFELPRKIPAETNVFWSPHYNIPLFYSGKLVVTVHDIFHLAMPQYVGGLHKRLYARLMFTAVRRKADSIICVSHFTESELMRLTNKGYQKINVIYNGVDELWFGIKKMQNPHGRAFILYVGNVKPHKNLKVLIQAFNLIVKKIPHDLVIIGKREGLITPDKKVVGVVANLNRVHFIGSVEDNTLQQYFAHADVLVLPSMYEGFGLPPLEAMACGCPVVVSKVASLPEVCGDAAYYINPYDVNSIADGIYDVITKTDLKETLITKGLQRAKMFSWEKSAKEHIKVFEEVLNS